MAKFVIEYKGAGAPARAKTVEANSHEIKDQFLVFYDTGGNVVYAVAIENLFSYERIGD